MDDNEVWQRALVKSTGRQLAGRAWRSAATWIARSCEFVVIGPAHVRGRIKYGNDNTACTVHESKRDGVYIPQHIQNKEDTCSHAEV
jgi:hypothetical protein